MKTWWKSLSQREQRLVMGAGGACLLAVLYWGIWQPMTQRAEMAERNLNSQRQLLSWVQTKANQIAAYKQAGGAVAVSDKGLSQVVNETTSRYKIELIRMQPRDNDSALQVWVKPLPFNALVNWLTVLQEQYGIDVQLIDVTKGERDGTVEVNRLQLGRS
ncbi:TPA: type II secretion system protein M [Photobacterium damselae]